jgi:ATP-dependent DNA helicase RecG
MPSALETLVKILRLEREQGYKNSAVIGGLGAFSEKWTQDAHEQARKPEHHVLVDELAKLLREYEQVNSKSGRHDAITYMLDRIMGRVQPVGTQNTAAAPPPAPPPQQQQITEAPPPPQKAEPPPHREQGRVEERRERRQDNRPPKQQNANRPEHRQDKKREGGWEREEFNRYDDPVIGRIQPQQRKDNRRQRPTADALDIPPQPTLARAPRKPRPVIDAEEAADITRGLNAAIKVARGVGPKMAQLLGRLGVETIRDLLFLLPRRYDDYTRLTSINKLKPDMVATVIGTVRQAEVRVGKSGRKDFFLILDDGSGRIQVTFFGQQFLVRHIRVGKQLVLSGPTSIYGNRIQMTNPEWEELDAENLHTIGIVPVYPLTEGLRARVLRKLMKNTVEYWAERLADFVPEATLERAELADLGWTMRNLHFPEGWDHLQHAQNRYVFDQLLRLQLAILSNRREWQSVPGQSLPVSDEFVESFIQTVFPYPLTNAQRRAIQDIRGDIAVPTPMNRLLQGDVGSGKTAVAATALAMAFASGKQAALMAPTGILAEQHYRNVGATLARMPGERKPVVALLTGSLSSSERETVYTGLANGSIDIVIGTHAVIQEGVEFHALALAIIDEQHRFGVEQRKALRGKGMNPHLLIMTATPIPRTLALTLFADLDLSVMDEMPPGRVPVQTRVVEPVQRDRIYNFVESQLEKGRQAFIVHPLVEASDKIEAASAVEAYERLQKVYPGYKMGLLHGRMKPEEKDEVMAAFGAGKYHVLVTTSVAEVGVDVPNASVIVIEGANRFGLAQLHQFRGRVGRGEHASYCLLIPDISTPEAQERLKAMEETNDGFRLAELDWKLRGAGDLVGTRQSGQQALQLAEVITPQLVELAQREARTIYAEDPDLSQPQHRLLAQWVGMLHNERSDVS